LRQLPALAHELKEQGEQAFGSSHPWPYLVLTNLPPADLEWIDPRTMESSLRDLGGDARGDRLVFAVPLAKSNRNAYGSKITLGRAKNNDIIIRASKISKLHAAFALEGAGAPSVMDMGSVNGTMVNGVRLAPRQPQALAQGDLIDFWRYTFRYYDPQGMIRLLKGKP
jgi:hypothetical protein